MACTRTATTPARINSNSNSNSRRPQARSPLLLFHFRKAFGSSHFSASMTRLHPFPSSNLRSNDHAHGRQQHERPTRVHNRLLLGLASSAFRRVLAGALFNDSGQSQKNPAFFSGVAPHVCIYVHPGTRRRKTNKLCWDPKQRNAGRQTEVRRKFERRRKGSNQQTHLADRSSNGPTREKVTRTTRTGP